MGSGVGVGQGTVGIGGSAGSSSSSPVSGTPSSGIQAGGRPGPPGPQGPSGTGELASTLYLYVNAVTGNDSNPGTQAAPFQTLQAALAALPALWQRKVRVYLAAGTYTLPAQFTHSFGMPIGPGTTGDGGPTTASATQPDAYGGGGREIYFVGTYATQFTGTVTSVTNVSNYITRVTDTGQAFGVHAIEGMICRFTSGAATGYAFRVRENAATTFDPLYPLGTSPLPGAGDTYVIERAATIVKVNYAAFQGSNVGINTNLVFDGISFQPAVNLAQLWFIGMSAIFNGVDFGDYTFTNGMQAYFWKGDYGFVGQDQTDSDLTGDLRRLVGVGVWDAGCYFQSASAQRSLYLLLRGQGASAATLQFYGQSTGIIQGFDAKDGFILARDASYVSCVPVPIASFASMRFSGGPSPGAIQVTRGAFFRVLGPGALDVSSSTAAGIYAEEGATIDLLPSAPTVTSSAGNNGTYGVTLAHFSRAMVNGNVSITGTTGDVLAGATAGTWAAINGGTALVETKSQTAAIPT